MWSRLHTVASPLYRPRLSDGSRRNRTQSRPATIFFTGLKKGVSQRDVIFNFVCIMRARRGAITMKRFSYRLTFLGIFSRALTLRAHTLQQYINWQLIRRKAAVPGTRILIPSGFAARRVQRERAPSTNLKLCPAATIHLY